MIACFKRFSNHRSSLKSVDQGSEIFRAIYPDSDIANGFKMYKGKAGYILTFGLGKYYSQEAIKTAMLMSL